MAGMKVMPSSEFRVKYANLTEPTQVTVLGRVIGTWTPGGSPRISEVEQSEKPKPAPKPRKG